MSSQEQSASERIREINSRHADGCACYGCTLALWAFLREAHP